MEDLIEEEKISRFSLKLIGDDDIDDEELDNMTRSLISELNEISGINQVTTIRNDLTSDSKGTKGITDVLGKLMVDLSVKAAPSVVGFIKDWVMRPGAKPVEIEISGKGKVIFQPKTITIDEIERLISALQSNSKK